MKLITARSYCHFLLAILIVAGTCLVFRPALSFDFVNWDDDVYVYENARVQELNRENVGWFFTHAYYHSYIPITMISHMIDWRVWETNPSGHHLTNVFLHAMNAGWIFVLSLNLLRLAHAHRSAQHPPEDNDRLTILLSSMFAAAAYAWHPLRVESVAWISDRKDLLCVFFLIPSALAYLKYVSEERKRKSWAVASWALFSLACISKAIAMTAPLVFLLLDLFLLHRRDFKKMLIEKSPLFAVAVVVGIAATNAAPDASSNDMFEVMSPLSRALVPFYNITFYVVKTLLPMNLSPMYPSASETMMVGACVLFILITGVGIRQWKKQSPFFLLAWFSYLILIAPSSVLASTIIQTTADRYSYLATVPLFILFGAALREVLQRFALNKLNRIALLTTMTVIVFFLAFTNYRQQAVWTNSATLWGRAIELFPTMPLPYNNFGLAMQSRGEHLTAEGSFRRAIELKPNYVEAHVNLGNLLFEKRDLNEAERLFLRAAELDSTRAETSNNLGIVASAKGNSAEALRWLQRSVALNSSYAQGHYNLASLYQKLGNTAAAKEAFAKAAQLGHARARAELDKVLR